MTEYIYLLQKREFIKTKENIYKIGKTKQENLKRISNYENGSILICQIKCNDCDKLEKKLITLFRQKYELQKEIGNEYFKGNCDDMRDDIYNYIQDENIIEDFEDEEDIDENIYEMFPNYKDDESFGGKKKLIKISFEPIIKYNRIWEQINTYYIDDQKQLDSIFIQRDWFQKDDSDNSDYISKLLKNNVIQDGMIYDFNDSRFIKKLNKHKDKINITYTDENIIDMISKFKTLDQNNIVFKIDRIIYNNCLLHEEIYCDYINNTLHIDFIIPYDNSLQMSDANDRIIKKQIDVIKFNNITYDYLFLRKYTPYCMELKDDKYYFYNSDYQIIDKNEKKYSIENWNGKRIYFDGEIGLIFNKDKNNFKNYIERINNHISNMICMNMNENTQIILNLYK